MSEKGIEETKKLAEEGIYPSSEGAQYATSGMIRADMTINIIYGDVPRKRISNLRELNFGDFELKPFEEIKENADFIKWRKSDEVNLKTYLVEWFKDDSDSRPPNGESKGEFAKRILKGLKELEGYHRLKELSNRHNGNDSHTVMVCHGGVTAMCMLINFQGERTFWEWVPKPGHGYTVYYEDGEPIKWEAF